MAMYFCGIMANNWTYCRLMTSQSPASMLRPNNDNGLSLVDFSGRAKVKTERSNPTILQFPAASHIASFLLSAPLISPCFSMPPDPWRAASMNIPAVSEGETMTLTRTVGASILAFRDKRLDTFRYVLATLDDATSVEGCGPPAEYSRCAMLASFQSQRR